MTGTKLKRRVYRRILDELLAPMGFKFHNGMLVRKLEGIDWRIARQPGGIRLKGRTEFAFNLGVYVDGFLELRKGEDTASSRHVEDGAIYTRLTDDGRDQWWVFDFDHDGEERAWIIAGEVIVLLERYGLPFLERFQSIHDVIATLESPPPGNPRRLYPFPFHSDVARLENLAIVFAAAGHFQNAREAIASALGLTKANDKETRTWLAELDDRIVRLMDEKRSAAIC